MWLTCAQTIAHRQSLQAIEDQSRKLICKLANATAESRQMFNELMEIKGNIRVVCRIRPQVRAACEFDCPGYYAIGLIILPPGT